MYSPCCNRSSQYNVSFASLSATLINWIQSALLPACSVYLSTRHFKRYGAKREGLAIKKVPSEYFHEQIYTTFFNDAVGGHILTWWCANNCM
jgi:hypothetical protein